ncbi:MAG: glycosyltransferase [Chloroflexi bacterium]|nr:glycosyltransferase [Chloroflexota bacterium]
MRILFVTPYAPTVIRTRPYNFLCGLAQAGHRVTLATIWQDAADHESLGWLAAAGIELHAERLTRTRIARNVARAVFGRAPLQASFAWHPHLAAQLVRLVESRSFDVAHVEHLRGARYALALAPRLPTVWDSVDCISALFAQAQQYSLTWRGRLMTTLELGRTRRFEAALVTRFHRVLVTSDADKRALDALASGLAPSPVRVVPNGVVLVTPAAGQPRQRDTIVLSGKMSYHANITAALHFVREILPLIWAERPQTRLWIVGQSPPPAVLRLAADERITVTGAVPDMATYLSQATVAVCPVVYGAGVQNKVLEAMACATPVVSTGRGLGAVAASDGAEVLRADTPAEFARAVLRLLADDAQARRIGEAGRAYVERAHNWYASIAALEAIYAECVAGR